MVTIDDPMRYVFNDLVTEAPWTPEQVANLTARQKRSDLHPYTCPQHSGVLLTATEGGWRCPLPRCEYRQDWAYLGDLEGIT